MCTVLTWNVDVARILLMLSVIFVLDLDELFSFFFCNITRF